jgi:hypothetical protein
MSLALKLSQFKQPADPFSPRVNVAKGDEKATHLADVSREQLWAMLHEVTSKVPEGDAKLKAAYLIGYVSYSACNAVAFLALNGVWLRKANIAAFGFEKRKVQWNIGGETGENTVLDITLDPQHLDFGDEADPYLLGQCIEAVFSELVEMLFEETKLGRKALWRLVADSLAYTMLQNGRMIGDEQMAMDIATQIVRDKRLNLFNKQTGFEWVALPENPNVGEWMRLRGGCCRHYTLPNDDAVYCTTCVLRDPTSRVDRYRDYLRRRIAEAA